MSQLISKEVDKQAIYTIQLKTSHHDALKK